MPAIRRKPSEDSASHKRHRKSIKVSSYLSSESDEEYVDLEADLEVASRSESNNDGSSASGVSTERVVSVTRRGAANNATEATAPEPIAISGILLRPTVAFDTFWRFAAERKAIYDRRRAGEPAP
jgi:hypothetical protein